MARKKGTKTTQLSGDIILNTDVKNVDYITIENGEEVHHDVNIVKYKSSENPEGVIVWKKMYHLTILVDESVASITYNVGGESQTITSDKTIDIPYDTVVSWYATPKDGYDDVKGECGSSSSPKTTQVLKDETISPKAIKFYRLVTLLFKSHLNYTFTRVSSDYSWTGNIKPDNIASTHFYTGDVLNVTVALNSTYYGDSYIDDSVQEISDSVTYSYQTSTSDRSRWTSTTIEAESIGAKCKLDAKLVFKDEDIRLGVVYRTMSLVPRLFGTDIRFERPKSSTGTSRFDIGNDPMFNSVTAHYPLSAIWLEGALCLHRDGTAYDIYKQGTNRTVTTLQTGNIELTYAGLTGGAKAYHVGGNSSAEIALEVYNAAGAYKFYLRFWGVSVPSIS